MDISEKALEVAKENLMKHEVEDRVKFIFSDLLLLVCVCVCVCVGME